MPDSNLNLTVSVKGQAELQSLFDKIQDGNATLEDQAKFAKLGTQAWRAMTPAVQEANASFAQAIASSRNVVAQGLLPLRSELAKQRDSYFALGESIRSTMSFEQYLKSQNESFTDTIRGARQERRLYTFAINEGMNAVQGITGKETELTKAVSGGAQAVFGMQFALTAMGGVFAEFALPVAIAIGAWTILKTLWKDSGEELKKLREEQVKDIDILIKLGEATSKQKEEVLKAQLATEQATLTEMQTVSTWNVLLATLTGGKYTGGTSATDITAQKTKVDALRLSLAELHKQESEENAKALDKFKEQMDEQIAEEDKQSKQKIKNAEEEQKLADKNRAALIEEQDYQRAIGNIDDVAYLTILRKRLEQAELVKSRKEELAVLKEFQALYDKNPVLGEITLQSSLAGKNYGGFATPQRSINPEAINADQFGALKTTEQYNAESKAKLEASATNQYLIDPLKSGFQSLSYSALTSLNRMWEQSSGFARTVWGQAIEQIGDTLINNLAKNAVSGLASLIPGIGFLFKASGGDISYGGNLRFAANGINLSYGSGVQNVVVGEQGKELMQVGRNGVRVISNNNLNMMNQASRSGGSFNLPAPQIIPLISASGVSVMVKYGQQSRSGRVWG